MTRVASRMEYHHNHRQSIFSQLKAVWSQFAPRRVFLVAENNEKRTMAEKILVREALTLEGIVHYTLQHKHYCGVDLHPRSMPIAVGTNPLPL